MTTHTASEPPLAQHPDFGPGGLAQLEVDLAQERELYRYAQDEWVLKHTPNAGAERLVDVLIVGAGQAGVTVAAQLQRQGVHRVVLIDRKSAGNEGPWTDWARMHTLRSPKHLHGPDGGWPSATFERWYTVQHGAAAYEALGFIPKHDWQGYLQWLRRVLALEVRNDTALANLRWDRDRWRVTIDSDGVDTTWEARKVVLCTGLDGLGGVRIPEFMADVPRHLWSGPSDPIPDELLTGKTIGVLGGGATAYDNAAHAAEQGASRVVQFQRSRPEQQSVPLRSLEYGGLFQNLRLASDEMKLRFAKRYFRSSVPAPDYTIARCQAQPNYELRLGESWLEVRETPDGRAEVRTAEGSYVFDHLILGTGFRIALDEQPFLAEVAPGIRTWRDHYGWGPDEEPYLAAFPYLDAGFRAQPTTPEWTRAMHALHFFSLASDPSVGPIASGVNGLPWGGRILAEAVSADFFLADIDQFADEFERFAG